MWFAQWHACWGLKKTEGEDPKIRPYIMNLHIAFVIQYQEIVLWRHQVASIGHYKSFRIVAWIFAIRGRAHILTVFISGAKSPQIIANVR